MEPTNIERRTRMKGPERREAILQAAEGAFARLGFHATTMADIAAAAGITQPMLYRHFRSKRELFLAVMDRAPGQIAQLWQQAPHIFEMGTQYLQFMVRNRDAVRVRWLAMAESEDPEIMQRLQHVRNLQRQLVTAALERARAEGLLNANVSVPGAAQLFEALGLLIDYSLVVQSGEDLARDFPAGLLFFQLIAEPGLASPLPSASPDCDPAE